MTADVRSSEARLTSPLNEVPARSQGGGVARLEVPSWDRGSGGPHVCAASPSVCRPLPIALLRAARGPQAGRPAVEGRTGRSALLGVAAPLGDGKACDARPASRARPQRAGTAEGGGGASGSASERAFTGQGEQRRGRVRVISFGAGVCLLLTSAKGMRSRSRVAQAPSPVRIGDSAQDTAEGGCATFPAPTKGRLITFAEVNKPPKEAAE